MRNITVRKANINDARYFSELVLLSAPYFPILFGTKIKVVLEHLFSSSGNLFSYEHVYFGTINKRIASMILGYSWKDKKREDLRTGFLLLKYVGVRILNKLPVLLKFNATVGRLNEGEYYISNIATFHKFRGNGIGKRLMLIAENEARMSSANRIVLDVEKDNIGAISFYKKLGYKVVNEFLIPFQRYKPLHFYRMAKEIG